MARFTKWLASVLCGFIYLAIPVVSTGTDEPPRLKIPPRLQVVRTVKPKTKSVTPLQPSVPSKSAPSWNVTGSMARAYNKTSLINHLLSHGNHSGKWSRAYLQSLTINQLWHLHDSDHNATRYRTAKPVNNWKPMKTWKKLCPT